MWACEECKFPYWRDYHANDGQFTGCVLEDWIRHFGTMEPV